MNYKLRKNNLRIKKWVRIAFTAIFAFFVLFMVGAPVVLAQSEYIPLAPIPGVADAEGANLGDYLPNLYRLGIGIAAALSVIVLAWGGIRYMTSEVISSKSAAIGMMRNAVGGLVLALSSFVLLNTINPSLVSFNLNLREVGVNIEGPPAPVANADTLQSLQQVLTLLQREAERASEAMRTSPQYLTLCYAHYDQMVRQEIRFVNNVVMIVRNTPRGAAATVSYSGVLSDIVTIASPFYMAEWDNIADLIKRLDVGSERNVQIRDTLAVFIETDIKGATEHHALTLMTPSQKEKAGERLKKGGENMTALANALLGSGADAVINSWTNYNYCSAGDTFADALDKTILDPATGEDVVIRGTLVLAEEDLNDEFSGVSGLISGYEGVDYREDPNAISMLQCGYLYREIVRNERNAVTDIKELISAGLLTPTARETKLNEIKAATKNRTSAVLAVDFRERSISSAQEEKLRARVIKSESDLNKLAPTPCARTNPAPGCGGGTLNSSAISASYDLTICAP